MPKEYYKNIIKKHNPELYELLSASESRGAAIDWKGFSQMAEIYPHKKSMINKIGELLRKIRR